MDKDGKNIYGLYMESTNPMPWNQISEEIKQKANQLLKDHNDAVNNPNLKPGDFYAVDVTGKHQVYYTFWRFRDIPIQVQKYIKNPIYFGNLSTNLLEAIKKALSKPVVRNVPVQLWNSDTREGLIGKTKTTPSFTFGKYRGRSFPDVYLEDPGYFLYLSRNADPKYAGSATNQAIMAFADMARDDMTERNRQNIDSNYVGNIGERNEFELELVHMQTYPPREGEGKGYTTYKMRDADGNRFYSYQFPSDNVGDKVKVRATIKDHKERMGVKFTRLSRIKTI